MILWTIIAIVLSAIGVLGSMFELWLIKAMLHRHHETIHEMFHKHLGDDQ